MSDYDSEEDCEKYDYEKLLRQPEWRAKRAEILGKSPRCQLCGRSNTSFAVHHKYYEYAILPWEYPSNAYMIVCNGKCHRQADADRAEQEEDAKIDQQFGWQGALGKQCQKPNARILKELADHEPEFIAWLWRQGVLRDGWNWTLYPSWHLWGIFRSNFLAKAANYEAQLTLDL